MKCGGKALPVPELPPTLGYHSSDLPASVSQVLGLKVCITTARLFIFKLVKDLKLLETLLCLLP